MQLNTNKFISTLALSDPQICKISIFQLQARLLKSFVTAPVNKRLKFGDFNFKFFRFMQ